VSSARIISFIVDNEYLCSPLLRIFSLLSAILHLGNIRYKKKTYRDDSIDICNPEVLPIVSELLEVSGGFLVLFGSRCVASATFKRTKTPRMILCRSVLVWILGKDHKNEDLEQGFYNRALFVLPKYFLKVIRLHAHWRDSELLTDWVDFKGPGASI